MLQSTLPAANAAVHVLPKADLPVPARAIGAHDITLQPAGRSGRSHGCGGSRCAGMGAMRGGGIGILKKFCENSLFLLQFATAHAIKSYFNQRVC